MIFLREASQKKKMAFLSVRMLAIQLVVGTGYMLDANQDLTIFFDSLKMCVWVCVGTMALLLYVINFVDIYYQGNII